MCVCVVFVGVQFDNRYSCILGKIKKSRTYKYIHMKMREQNTHTTFNVLATPNQIKDSIIAIIISITKLNKRKEIARKENKKNEKAIFFFVLLLLLYLNFCIVMVVLAVDSGYL